MSFIVDPKIEEYAEAHTTPDGELFERLAEETRAKTTAPQMMVGRIEGRFLATLVALSGAHRILEFGTFTGYSSISMASALPPDGKVITLDVDPEATAIARRYMDESGHGEKIEIRLGPALETLQDVEGPFDLVFIDADKENYVNYYEAALPLLADDGLLIADNVLWSGRVVEDEGDESTRAIKEFNEHVAADERVVSVMLTVRDGMTLVRKRESTLMKASETL
jgi:caffeoyl-CoA O-methyltransferase